MNMPTSEVLDLAADKVQEHGWRQGDEGWTNNDGRGLCLEGGIAAVLGSSIFVAGTTLPSLGALWRCPAYKAVQEYLETKRDLWRWNDDSHRTQEDVIAVLRAAAAVERAKEAAYAPVDIVA